MKKILIAGIGGTGGFFGGMLASHYSNSKDTEIYFLCRGKHLDAIREKGLQVKFEDQSFVAHPNLASDDPKEIGVVDLLICCTKAYDLEQTMSQLQPCVGPQTVILPLQNGVDSFNRIQKIYPQNEIWEGCVYIVSRLAKPGIIADTGNIRKLFFGSDQGTLEKLLAAEKLFKAAGIDATLSTNIQQTIWEKFLFISTMASLTSYHNQTIGQVLEDAENVELLNSLLHEFKSVAGAKGIILSEDIISKAIERMKGLPYDTTSSMHSDLQNNRPIELESLVGHIVREGRQLNVATPAYESIYGKLKAVCE